MIYFVWGQFREEFPILTMYIVYKYDNDLHIYYIIYNPNNIHILYIIITPFSGLNYPMTIAEKSSLKNRRRCMVHLKQNSKGLLC